VFEAIAEANRAAAASSGTQLPIQDVAALFRARNPKVRAVKGK
jgi:hypothetical protein